jgi:hypothetical protein
VIFKRYFRLKKLFLLKTLLKFLVFKKKSNIFAQNRHKLLQTCDHYISLLCRSLIIECCVPFFQASNPDREEAQNRHGRTLGEQHANAVVVVVVVVVPLNIVIVTCLSERRVNVKINHKKISNVEPCDSAIKCSN